MRTPGAVGELLCLLSDGWGAVRLGSLPAQVSDGLLRLVLA
jgi:hypothetical protein